MNPGSRKFWTSVITGVLVVAVAIAVVPLLDRFKASVDLTEDQRFTLPDEARRIAGRLEDEFVVKVYLSSTMPSFLRHLPRALRTRLQEFRDASNGRLSFEFVSPDEWRADDERIEQLNQRKIQPIPIRDSEDGKITMGSYWLTMEFRYRDKEDVLPLAQLGTGILLDETEVLRTLPFLLASRIVKLTTPKTSLGIVSKRIPMGRDPQDPNKPLESDGLEQLRTQLSNSMPSVIDVALTQGANIGEEVRALLIHRPENFDQEALRKIDQFILRGGNVVVLLDNFETADFVQRMPDWQSAFQRDQGRLRVRPIDRGQFDAWLLAQGISVKPGVLESLSPERVNLGVIENVIDPRVGFARPQIVAKTREHPLLVMPAERGEDKAETDDFDLENPWFAGLGKAGFLAAVPLEIQRGAEAKALMPETAIEVLVQTPATTAASAVVDGQVPLWRWADPSAAATSSSTGQRYPLVVSVSGPRKAVFDAPPPPAAPSPDDPPAPLPSDHLVESRTAGRLVVVADSDFATTFGLIALGGNPQAVPQNLQSQNGMTTMMASQVGVVRALDALLLGEDLVAMRRPRLARRLVDQAKVEEDKTWIRFAAIGLPSLLLVGLGVATWVTRSLTTGATRQSDAKPAAESKTGGTTS